MRKSGKKALDKVPVIEYISMDDEGVAFSPEEKIVLNRVNRKIAAGQSLDDIMTFAFEATRGIIPCDRLGLAFIEEDGRRVVAYWAKAVYEPLFLKNGFAQDIEGSSLKEVLQTGTPRIINDLEQYAREHPDSASTRAILHEGIRSSMTCPIWVEERPIGFLFRSARQPHAYDLHHVRLHQAIAERLGQTIEKAWRIERLHAVNRAYFEILGFVSHELKSPLASIVMDIYSLESGMFGPVTDSQREKLGRMVKKAQYLLGMVEEYIGLSRLESNELEAKYQSNVDFRTDVIDPALVIVDSLAQDAGMTIEQDCPEAPLSLQCDPALMTVVMVNLLGNAVKYGKREGRIRIRAHTVDGRLRVSVWNEGPGFPPEEKPRLFRKFSRLRTPELLKRKGTGVGLYSTWRIIQLHGGRIWADSEPGQWAEFSFEIPLAPGR
ncbi:MAG TPA: GAF domain-containing sensor histidine kinase [Candidatus Hydrogenedentes bacterium]|nr:GAF domain-containing sensor histidine kinase [Candidatus Hydrogenedentota bacterium]HOV73582.1 GAF domain-containing sensor histidine kinase [Candidatus Hydrogenedentota bacterium]HPC16520.1 GAF domain-containing sensor histidine kinase [Candidatus Hydrogenedentota bacterium]HRT18981.1 GAF domain-containing sensor histidine kinase [Candidatus Hydrogenedentota bacterium]HRT65663.1 GAF domain-containing sensor histidine kinase [Candidatus Hydrogenedentota bacterium]